MRQPACITSHPALLKCAMSWFNETAPECAIKFDAYNAREFTLHDWVSTWSVHRVGQKAQLEWLPDRRYDDAQEHEDCLIRGDGFWRDFYRSSESGFGRRKNCAVAQYCGRYAD